MTWGMECPIPRGKSCLVVLLSSAVSVGRTLCFVYTIVYCMEELCFVVRFCISGLSGACWAGRGNPSKESFPHNDLNEDGEISLGRC